MFFNDVSIVTRQEHVFTTDTKILNPQGLIIFFCVVVPGFLSAQVPIADLLITIQLKPFVAMRSRSPQATR
jgi:hypothetical protein